MAARLPMAPWRATDGGRRAGAQEWMGGAPEDGWNGVLKKRMEGSAGN
jgi:hypothetical protein